GRRAPSRRRSTAGRMWHASPLSAYPRSTTARATRTSRTPARSTSTCGASATPSRYCAASWAEPRRHYAGRMSTNGADPHPEEKQRGPVVLRRERRNEATTTDERLLDSRGPSDWVHTDPWRVLRIQAEFVEGFGSLAEVPRAVTVFGSARTPRDHPEYAIGRELGAALAEAGYAVITGGGPGVME